MFTFVLFVYSLFLSVLVLQTQNANTNLSVFVIETAKKNVRSVSVIFALQERFLGEVDFAKYLSRYPLSLVWVSFGMLFVHK